MNKCFIIMPITTPNSLIPKYSDDSDHFSHVLEHLFVPAVEKADFKPVPPIAKGADLIHAEIIKNIEKADLVLCDISCLNPNVFFELGIRTALNKPVCYVKDDQTKKIPFDNSIINHHTYKANLAPWILDKEIERLGQHILDTTQKSDGTNSLWKYFGLTTIGSPSESDGGIEDRLELLNIKFDSLKNTIENTAGIEKAKYVAEKKKELEYAIAGISGERAAIEDLLTDKENFSSREEYEELLTDLERLDREKSMLLYEISKIV